MAAMRVRLTQIIDFWVGVPLCFIFSMWHALTSVFRARSSPHPRKILFIELSEMGSANIGYSALARARQVFPQGELFFLTFHKNAESVELLGIIPGQNILTIPDDSFLAFALGTLRALWRIRRRGIDTTIDMELFSRASTLISYLTGAANRVGFDNFSAEGLYRGRLLTRRAFYNPHQHMSLNFLSLVFSLVDPEALPGPKRDLRSAHLSLPRYLVPKEERDQMLARLQAVNAEIRAQSTLIILNPDPGEALPLRGWPRERFAQTAAELLSRYPQAFVVVIGLPRSKEFARLIVETGAPGRSVDFTGLTASLREVMALLSLGSLLITNDSGPAHLAALTEIPAITLFGPETPALYGPLGENAIMLYSYYACSPCLSAHNHRYTLCHDNKCMQAISVERVVSESEKILGQPAALRAGKAGSKARAG